MNWQKHKRNKRGFTLEQCRKGGSAVRGGETEEEARQRALQDAKGMVLREGVTYTAGGAKHWCKRRALHGRVACSDWFTTRMEINAMDMTLMKQIADLMERVQSKRDWERAAVAGRDCLLEWDARGKNGLIETIKAWDDSILPNYQQTDTERHGAWVPAIPL